MKKILSIILCIALIFAFAGCTEKRGTDLEEVQKAGKLVVGITDYAPMNYKIDGEWTGFDTEFATLFAKELGVEVEFVEIIWADRYTALDEYKIDCIWNAMTIMPMYQTNYSVSDPYVLCGQVLVMKADVVDNYENGYDVRKLKFALEKGSAGESCIVDREGFKNVVLKPTQQDALAAVAKGEADAAVVDVIIADMLVGKGKQFPQLAKGFDYSSEYCGVAFRKDSDLTEKLNEFMDEIRDEELIELANKYGLTLY